MYDIKAFVLDKSHKSQQETMWNLLNEKWFKLFKNWNTVW